MRCGYCDFNTYTATELGGGASQDAYAGTAVAEVDFAGRVLNASGLPERRLSTVFFGGGTPTLLPPRTWRRILRAAIGTWGLEPGAEVTTEANPDSVTPESLRVLADAGFTRVSFGMQSAVPARPEGPGPHPHARAGCRRWSSGPARPAWRSAST